MFLHTSALADSLATALRFTLSVPGRIDCHCGNQIRRALSSDVKLCGTCNLAESQYEYIRQVWEDRASPDWHARSVSVAAAATGASTRLLRLEEQRDHKEDRECSGSRTQPEALPVSDTVPPEPV